VGGRERATRWGRVWCDTGEKNKKGGTRDKALDMSRKGLTERREQGKI